MSTPFSIFKIRREERWLFLVSLLAFAALNALMIGSHWDMYTKPLPHGGAWSVFHPRFEMSGYDGWSWMTLSEMRIHFETNRHPLYLSFLYPMYWLNHWLMQWTGMNWATLMIAVVLVFSAGYSAIFVYRILRELLGVRRPDACLLVALLFSFGHVMIPAMVPDHFIISMMLLTMTAYICGKKMRKHQLLRTWQNALLLFFTTGIATSNGCKTLLAALFTNGRRVFRPRFVLLGCALPLALLLAIQRYQYYAFEVPQSRQIANIEKANEKKMTAAKRKARDDHNEWVRQHGMRHIKDTGLLKLMDFETPRLPIIVENFLGESIMLHKDYALQDVYVDRPIVVRYRSAFPYIVNGLVTLLFLMGVWRGRKHRLMQMLLAWWGFDILLNLVLGFGVNEAYLFASGWMFTVPIAISFVLRGAPRRLCCGLRGVLLVLTCILWASNAHLIIDHLL